MLFMDFQHAIKLGARTMPENTLTALQNVQLHLIHKDSTAVKDKILKIIPHHSVGLSCIIRRFG